MDPNHRLVIFVKNFTSDLFFQPNVTMIISYAGENDNGIK